MGIRLEGLQKSSNIHELQEKFGHRPGDYKVNPYWFRINTFTNKFEVWNPETKKWKRITIGDEFDWDDEGNVVCVNN